MNAKVLIGGTPGGTRTVLGEVLPLDLPLLVQIFPVYACNFMCGYCFHALPKQERGYECSKTTMDFELFRKGIDDLRPLSQKIKMLRIAGLGEPLLHPDIAKMVEYAKKSGVFENINIVTNASMLTKELSLQLIREGLDMLRISIQGLSSEEYKKASKIDVDFKKLVENIRFFYENRGSTKVYIKIIDCALKNETEKENFLNIFGDISDLISIECMTPTVKGINYEKISKSLKFEYTQSGNHIARSSICSMPFYMVQINPDGNVVPCCGWRIPAKLGNLKKESLQDIWNSDTFNKFRARMLTDAVNCGNVCAECTLYHYGQFPEDILDEYKGKLLSAYKK